MDRSEYDIPTDAASWNIYPAQVESEPIVAAFSVIVHPDPVSIDTNASIVVKIVGQDAKVTQPMKYFAVAIKDMELSGYRADTASSCNVGNHFLVLATIAPQRGSLRVSPSLETVRLSRLRPGTFRNSYV